MYGFAPPLKVVPAGPSHVYCVARGIALVLIDAVVVPQAATGNPFIGGLGTETVGDTVVTVIVTVAHVELPHRPSALTK